MAEPVRPEVRYTAFLSYSHKDAAAAGRLHRRLEAYRLPKRLAGSQTARGIVPDRLWPIFRDREELPAATDLSETVREALAQSGALIVLCSPHSAQSLWVAEEIETFRRLHPARPILAAILDGDPPDCFPAALRAFGQDGTWHEPLATDLRRGRDGAHLGLLKLVAGITGVSLDALVQRDAARRVRRVTAVTGAALVAMLIMAALAWFAFDARREAERQRTEAEGQIEFMLTDLREKLRGVGRLDIMTAVNQRALAYYERQQLNELSPDSLERRSRILLAMGEDDLNRDKFRQALSAFREAHRTTAEQLGRSPNNPDRIFAHSQSEYWVGYVDYRRRNFGPARDAWRRYQALVDRLLAIDADNPRWLAESGYAEGNLCTIALAEPANAAAALQHCDMALRRMERVRSFRPEDPAIIEDLVNRHAWIADAWNANGRWDKVRFHRARQEELLGSLLERDPNNLDYQDLWLRSQFTFGRLLAEHGQRIAARERFGRASSIAAILRRRDPENASWRNLDQRIRDSAAALDRDEQGGQNE